MIWLALALVAAIGFTANCHQSAAVFEGQAITPELAAVCHF